MNSGATHNFKLTIATNYVKTMNIVVATLMGLTKGMTTRVGWLCDQLDFLIFQIDDFDAILGVDFVVRAKIEIFLHCHRLIICRGD